MSDSDLIGKHLITRSVIAIRVTTVTNHYLLCALKELPDYVSGR